MILREELKQSLDALLECAKFKDYCPNGLQVEGKPKIERLVSGVTASLALIEEVIELKADAVLVHHGLFWKNQSGVITSWMKARLAKLLAHDIIEHRANRRICLYASEPEYQCCRSDSTNGSRNF